MQKGIGSRKAIVKKMIIKLKSLIERQAWFKNVVS